MRLYDDLTSWWPLLSAPEDYEEEAEFYARQTELTGGTNRVTAPGFDIDALTAYLATGNVAPAPTNRITKLG